MNRRILTALFISSFFIGIVQAAGKNKPFPQKDKIITIICPQAAGGGTDAIIRALTTELNKKKGVRVEVKNMPGNGTALGTEYVLNQPADGYTLLVGGTFTITATQQGLTKGYNLLDSIAGLNEDPFIIAVKKQSGYTTFSQLVSDAKKIPGKISIGHAGKGSANYIACLGVNAALGKPFVVKSYNGGAGVLEAVKKEDCVAGVFSQSELVSSPDLVPLVILTDGHSTLKELSAVPTLSEQGYDIEVPGYSYRALMVKTGTPQAVKSALAGLVNKAFYSASFQKYQKQNGLIQVYTELDKADRFMNALILEYMAIVREAHLEISSKSFKKFININWL